MTTLAELDVLIAANEDAFYAIAASYEALLGGVPTISGFEYLLNFTNTTNYGSYDPMIEFNRENAFINGMNALVSGNADAASRLADMVAGADTLTEQVLQIYDAFVPTNAWFGETGKAWLTRSEALDYYQQVADERGADTAAVVLAVVVKSVQDGDLPGIGDTLWSLRAAIGDGTATMLQSGSTLIPMEEADGVNYDNDDVSIVGASYAIDFG